MIAPLAVMQGSLTRRARPDMEVPGGAGFRRAPWPISDRPVPTQGNEMNTDMDQKVLPYVRISSQRGIVAGFAVDLAVVHGQPALGDHPERGHRFSRSLGPVISRSLPLRARVPDFSHAPVEGKR